MFELKLESSDFKISTRMLRGEPVEFPCHQNLPVKLLASGGSTIFHGGAAGTWDRCSAYVMGRHIVKTQNQEK